MPKAKGVTPIVSVVLLLLMTIALAGGVMVYLTGYTSGLQSNVVVKDSFCSRSADGNTLTFRVRVANVGSSGSITDLTATILSAPDESITLTLTQPTGENVPAGQQQLITFTANNATTDPAVGTYVADIASTTGNSRATFSCP